jgi:hypothetical protein
MATWSHEIKRQTTVRNGFDVLVVFVRSGTGDVRQTTFHFDTEAQITSEGPARLANKKTRLELRWSALNNFDLGDGGEAKEIMIKLIKAIRNNPNLTIAQVTSWYDTNYPEGLYNGLQLILKIQKWLTKELGFEPTWDQFKTYVTNNVFEGVD